MRGEVVSVGTEMLLGMIADTNAQYLSQQLAELGVDLFWISQVGDNQARVVEVLQRGLARSDLIVVTGGLGPTEDDLTREAIASALGEEISLDPTLEQWLRETFARRGRAMPERNLKQATLIPSATALSNPVGTAPGWWVERDGKVVVAMPGVPAEMRMMWEGQVRDRLRERTGGGVLVTTTMKVLGIGEAAVEEQLGDLVHGTNPTVATYAKPDGVHIRVSAKAANEQTARAMLTPMSDEIVERFGLALYGRDNETLVGLAADLLVRSRWTLASAERGTAGALAAEIASDEGLMALYRGGFVLGPDGAPLRVVSPSPADLATAARMQTGADVGIAVTMTIANGRPTAELAVDVRDQIQTGSSRWNLAIPELRRRAAVEALALLLRTLREANDV